MQEVKVARPKCNFCSWTNLSSKRWKLISTLSDIPRPRRLSIFRIFKAISNFRFTLFFFVHCTLASTTKLRMPIFFRFGLWKFFLNQITFPSRLIISVKGKKFLSLSRWHCRLYNKLYNTFKATTSLQTSLKSLKENVKKSAQVRNFSSNFSNFAVKLFLS